MADQSNIDVLLDTVELAGKRVVDIGCGRGELVHQMAAKGADALGIDPNPDRIAAARGGTKGSERFEEGTAQSLPLAEGSVDVAVFFNSLHHVKPEEMDGALAEAARVLKPGGLLYLSEPLADGSHFNVMKPFNNETSVRALAQDAIRRLVDAGAFSEIDEKINARTQIVESFEAFCADVIDNNPSRAEVVERKKDEVRRLFDQLGRKVPGGFEFDRLTKINLLRKQEG